MTLQERIAAAGFFNQFNQLALRIAKGTHSLQITATLWEFNKLMGVYGSVFTSFTKDDESLESYKYVVACPPSWCQQYNANHWFAIDPCLIYGAMNSEPTLIQNIPVRSRGQKLMMEAARKVGFNSGIVVPANSPNGRSRLGVLYLGSDNPNYFNEESLQCTKLILRAMSAELLDWWTKQSRQELLQRTSLRIDEIELLRFTHEGLRAKEIAEAVGMSKAAVDQKLSRLSARFGTSSKKVASNIAFEHGLLS